MQRVWQKGGRWRGSFSFRTSVVLSGSILGQLIAFALLPIIARLYGTEAIGQAGATIAILGILSLIVFWQYDQAVIVANDVDLGYLILLAVALLSGMCLFLAGMLFLLGRFVPTALAQLDTYGINYTLVILLFPYAMFLLLVNLHLRNNQLSKVSVARLIYYGGSAVFQVLAAWLVAPTSQAFLLSQASAAFLAAVPLFPYRRIQPFWQRAQSLGFAETTRAVIGVSRTYIDFPRYQAGAQVLNAFSLNLPVLILNSAFSATWAGWYFMANRLVAAPVVLLSQAIGQVFYRDSAERERAGIEQVASLERVATMLVRIGVFFGVALGTTVPFLVPVLLGEEWTPVATIMQILLLVFVVTFFTSPLTTFLNVKGRQKGALGYYSLLALVRTAAVFSGWWFHSEWLLVWSYSLLSLAVMLPLFRYTIHSAGGSVRRIAANARHLLLHLAGVIFVAVVMSQIGLLDQWIGAAVMSVMLLGAGMLEVRRLRLGQTGNT